jgi:hypothetical protein
VVAKVRDTCPAKEFDILSAWVMLAPYEPRPATELKLIVRRILISTGWSNRTLAAAIGTTHPTIKAIKEGHEPERRPDLAQALAKVADIIDRLARLAGGDQAKLRTILQTPGRAGQTPLKLLADGQYAQAYLDAMDLFGRRRETGKLLNTTHAREPSRSTSPLFDEDGD